MKYVYVALVVFCFCLNTSAQNFSEDFQKVYNACLALRDATTSGSTSLMRSAAADLKGVDPKYFSTLKSLNNPPLSLDGHFIFDYEFVDSLLVNRGVYEFAQKYMERRVLRAMSSSGKIHMKTCCVEAEGKVQYTFYARGYQELAVVAETDGLVNLRVYDKANDRWYNDTQELNVGLPSRTRLLELPESGTTLLLEIINKTNEDISFVIISN